MQPLADERVLGGGTDLESEGDAEFSDNNLICPASLMGLNVMFRV